MEEPLECVESSWAEGRCGSTERIVGGPGVANYTLEMSAKSISFTSPIVQYLNPGFERIGDGVGEKKRTGRCQ